MQTFCRIIMNHSRVGLEMKVVKGGSLLDQPSFMSMMGSGRVHRQTSAPLYMPCKQSVDRFLWANVDRF